MTRCTPAKKWRVRPSMVAGTARSRPPFIQSSAVTAPAQSSPQQRVPSMSGLHRRDTRTNLLPRMSFASAITFSRLRMNSNKIGGLSVVSNKLLTDG